MAKGTDAGNATDNTEIVMTRTARDGSLIPVSADMPLTDDVLRSIGASGDAFADAMRIAEELGVEVIDAADEMGTGFQILPKEQKAMLVGKPFVIIKWSILDGDYDGVFATSAIVTADGGKYILNDGSTGICEQLRGLALKTGRTGWVRCPRGLRASSYATCKGCGKPRTAYDDTCANTLGNGSQCGNNDTARGTGETYYLDLSA